MKTKFRILVFFPVFALVFLGLEYLGQAMELLPKRTFSSNLVETVVVGLAASIFFGIWVRRRQKKSAREA